MAALSLGLGSFQFVGAPAASAAIYDANSSSYSSNDQAKFAEEVYFFDFGKLASGEARQDRWGQEATENNEAEFYGKRIQNGDSYTYTAADGLPEGLEVKVTVDSVKPMHENAKYPHGAEKGETIDDGIWARTVTWNDFFRPLDLNNPGSIDRDQMRSNQWFDPEMLYPSQPGAMLQLSNYLDPENFKEPGDASANPHGQTNQGYTFSINVEGTLNGEPVDLDLLASDGESTGIRVEDHENPFNSGDLRGKKGGVPENLQLTTDGDGGWEVVQDLVGKDGRYYYVYPNPEYPADVPAGHPGYEGEGKIDPYKAWAAQNGAKSYGLVDTELDENGGEWRAIPMSQPLLVSRSAKTIDVELDNHPYGKTGSRQGMVAGIFLPSDQGDAPESYGEASHLLPNWEATGTPKDPNDKPDVKFNDGNYVGNFPPQPDGGKNWLKDPSGASGDSEEDLDSKLFEEAFKPGGDGKVTIPATAVDSDVVAWVDLNRNGTFDAGERRVGEDNGDGTFTFDWSDADFEWPDAEEQECDEADPETADVYARVRVGGEGVTESDMAEPTGTVMGGEVEDLVFSLERECKTGEESVSVGDFAWIDKNRNGIQDEGEEGLEGVTLELEGPNGEPVKDVYGDDVEPTTTDEEGKYSFDNLPVLEENERYTVKVVHTPKGYRPTKAEQGEDREVDSSTGSATSKPLTEADQEDMSLDFGFVKTNYAAIGGAVAIGSALVLSNGSTFTPGSVAGSSESQKSHKEQDEDAPGKDARSQDEQGQDVPAQSVEGEASDAPSQYPGEQDQASTGEGELAMTGANVTGLFFAALAMILGGLGIIGWRRRREA